MIMACAAVGVPQGLRSHLREYYVNLVVDAQGIFSV
jgi:hypothetical protein